MCDHDPDQQQDAGYPDKGYEGIPGFFERRIVRVLDRTEIDEDAEAESRQEKDRLNHGHQCISRTHSMSTISCVP